MKQLNIVFLALGLAGVFVLNAFAAPVRSGPKPLPASAVAPLPASSESSPKPTPRATRKSVPRSSPAAAPISEYDEVGYNEFDQENQFYIFGGIDAGYSTYGALTPATEGDRSGFHGGLRALGAFYLEKWIFDAGLGWQYIRNTGTNADGAGTKVITRNVYLELSPRYRLSQKFSIGPVFDYWISSDNGLNPNITATPKNTSMWIGPEAIYEWMSDSWKYRIGGRWLLDLNVTGRSVNIYQLFFQIGFPLGGTPDRTPEAREQLKREDLAEVQPEPIPEATPWPEVTPEPLPESTPWATPSPEPTPSGTPFTEKGPKEKFVMSLDVNSLPFEFNSARLPRFHADRLREIGRFLGESPEAWRELHVKGHTDARGTHKYNDQLSLARAQTVRQHLVEGGAPRAKIKAMGYGKRKPIDPRNEEKAFTKNRRVELEFRGVKDVEIIYHGVSGN